MRHNTPSMGLDGAFFFSFCFNSASVKLTKANSYSLKRHAFFIIYSTVTSTTGYILASLYQLTHKYIQTNRKKNKRTNSFRKIIIMKLKVKYDPETYI